MTDKKKISKQRLLEIRKDAHENGRNDDYVAQILVENALHYFENDVEEVAELSDEERDFVLNEVVQAYEDGFFLKEFNPNK